MTRLAALINPNRLYGHVPLPHATEFGSGFDLVYLALWSCFADPRPPLATRWGKTTIAQMTGTDNANHPLSAVQCVFLAS